MGPEALKKGNLWAILIVILSGLAAIQVWHPLYSLILIVFGVLLALGFKALEIKDAKKNREDDDAQIKTSAQAAKEDVIKKLEAVTDVADELTMNLRSILEMGRRLIAYDPQGSTVVGEVLKAYSGFIEDYLGGAASFAGKYRKAQKYIKSKDPAQLRLEVKEMEKRIEDGEKGLDKICKEKKATLHRIEEMVADQRTIRESLAGIQATLESLEASITAAENEPDREKEILDELQLTISSTGRAIEKTLVIASKHDEAVKQG